MSFIVKHVGIPIAETIARMPVSKHLRELLRTQWLSLDDIRMMQERRLASVIEHCYNTVPLYRRFMDERSLTPEDIRSVEDLVKLPILTKEIIRANYPELVISSSFRPSQLIETTSSGSTGEPFKFVLSKEEKARKWAGLYRFWAWAGYELGDRIVSITAFPPRAFKKASLLRYLETRYSGILGLYATELSADNVKSFIETISRFTPKVIRGYSSTLHYLAQSLTERGVKLQVSAACTTGETIHDFQRELIEAAFGCKVYDGYGGEGMEIAGQCGHDKNYHINAEDVIVEILDEDGRPCEPGVEGQVVLTDLNRYSMPLIRYNIQDLAALSGKQCVCGRGLPMLERISGRLTDVGVTPSGKLISSYLFSILFRELVPRVKQFQVVQEKRDHLVVYIVPGDGFQEVSEYVRSSIRERVGSEVSIDIKTVEEIPVAPSGKRRLFISKCGIKPVGLTEEERPSATDE